MMTHRVAAADETELSKREYGIIPKGDVARRDFGPVSSAAFCSRGSSTTLLICNLCPCIRTSLGVYQGWLT
jgi:hypothetical protein